MNYALIAFVLAGCFWWWLVRRRAEVRRRLQAERRRSEAVRPPTALVRCERCGAYAVKGQHDCAGAG